jgi:RimJ/RimL family protein N-acetyltransferase
MTPLYGHDQTVAYFVAQFIPGCEIRGFSENYRAIGVLHGEDLIGGLVYHNWNPEAGVIEFSGASVNRRWLTRSILKALFSYPFEGVGCQMVCARVSERNTHLIRMLRAYGFHDVTVPRLFGRDENALVFTLTIEDWESNGFHEKKEVDLGQTITPEAA